MLTESLAALLLASVGIATQATPPAPIGPPVAAAGAAREAAPAFVPAGLAELDDESAHGIALCNARDGDLEGAIAALERIVKDSPGNELAARDLARTKALLALRDAWIDSARQSAAKIAFEVDGKKLVAAIERVENGFVFLAPNARKLDKLPLARIDALFVAREADKKEEQGGAAPWVRAFAFALCDDARWQKALKDTPEDVALRNDASRAYPALLRTGATASALAALARTPEPADASDALRVLDSITSLCKQSSDVPLMQRRRDVLARLAEASAFRAFTMKEAASLVRGTLGDFGSGDLKIVYEFDSPAELEDFEQSDTYYQQLRKKLTAQGESAGANVWEVADGALHCSGSTSYRHRLPFAAPMTIRIDYQCKGEGEQTLLFIALCSENDDAYIHANPVGAVTVYDAKAGFSEVGQTKSAQFFVGMDYRLELRHDGKTVKSIVDGETKDEVPAGPRKRGFVRFVLHADVVYAIKRLEIEGRVDPILLREQWIDWRLKEAGLR